MIRYPKLHAEVIRRGCASLAKSARVAPDEIAAVLAEPVGRAADPTWAERVATRVGIPDLFRLPESIEEHFDAIEAAGGSRYVTEPSIVRSFDRS